jgi:FkbM family methyltransferase
VALPPLSYAQRFEDFHLWRALGDVAKGFYVDVGGGHPVFDNVSFAFHLAGWRGIVVEPNPTLAALTRAVRPRDHLFEGLSGEQKGEATLYLQREFHGLSTTVAEHARAAEKEVNRDAEAVTLPMTTLVALCELHAPQTFEFLKVDVEGAEAQVLRGADFTRFRPKIVVVEAIEPLSLKPSFADWEPILTRHGYAYVWDDELNRYYVAEEARDLAARLTEGPKWYADGRAQIGNYKPAAEDTTHPDHGLAKLLASLDMTKLPLLARDTFFDILTAGAGALDQPADIAAIHSRLFGSPAAPQQSTPAGETIADAYRRIIDSDAFRASCGRIAASYAW